MTQDQDNYIKTLQAEIESRTRDNEALAQELKSGKSTDRTSASVIKEALTPHIPEYISNIHALAQTADSESVRLSANKVLIEWVATAKLTEINNDGDTDLRNLLNAIKAKAKT